MQNKMSKDMTALIVDDEIDICDLVSAMLHKEGLKCRAFQSITDGINHLQEQEYDVAFLDLNLPDGSGLDLVSYIKQHQPATRIFMISAHDSEIDKTKAIDAGVEAFISKPFTKADILNRLREG